MSIYLSRPKRIYSGCLSPMTSSSSFTKSQIFLDKKTITKRLQKLMLDVNDLETKMFLSKTISYIDGNVIVGEGTCVRENQNCGYAIVEKEQESQCTGKNQLKNYNQQVDAESQSRVNLHICPLQVSVLIESQMHQVQKNSQQMCQTATSEGFFPSQLPSSAIEKSTILEQSFSQGSTVQCQCGLFQVLLNMVGKLMKHNILKNIQQGDGECLQIDEQFVGEVTLEIIKKFAQMQEKCKDLVEMQKKSRNQVEKMISQLEKLKNAIKSKDSLIEKDAIIARESLAVRQVLKQKQAQYKKTLEQVNKLSHQLESLQKNYNILQTSFSQLQSQAMAMQRQKIQTELKLSNTQKQLQHLKATRELSQQGMQHKVESLQFQLQLKDHQIDNMKTIIECLEKKTKLFNQQQLRTMDKLASEQIQLNEQFVENNQIDIPSVIV